MTIPGVTYSYPKKRILAVFINLVFFIICAFLLDYWLSNVTFKKWCGFDSKREEYNQIVETYKLKQDEYGLSYYDEKGERHLKDKVDEATMNAFKNDSVVIQLIQDKKNVEGQLVGIVAASYAFFYVASSIVITIIFAVCFGKYLSLGYLLVGQRLVDEKGEKPKKNKIVLFALARWVCLVPLGVCTIFLLPVYFLYQVIYKENSITKLEDKFQLYCAIRSDLWKKSLN